MAETVIKLENVSKMYKLGVINNGTLFRDIQSWFALKMGKEDPHAKIGADKYDGSDTEFWALKDLNFEIKQGDRVGIIGKNGAGKSTLLKILSRITTPTEGTVKIRGRVSSLLEVGTGFHGELTGRENIYLNGAILGMKRREIDRKIDEIIDFSGIEKHIDTPVKRYSSGMYVRLAFAVAAHLDSDILIADEVLAVGDAEFQKKAIGKMSDLSTSQGRTVLFVSHNMAAVRKLCNTGVMLEKGRMKYTGEMEQTINEYMSVQEQTCIKRYDFRNYKRVPYNLFPFGSKIFIEEVEFLNTDAKIYKNTDTLKLQISYSAKETLSFGIGVSVKSKIGEPVCFIESEKLECRAGNSYSKILAIELSLFTSGSYKFYVEPYTWSELGTFVEYDETDFMSFEIIEDAENSNSWLQMYWGYIKHPRSRFLN